MKQILATLAFLTGMACPSAAQNNQKAFPASGPGSVTVVSDTTGIEETATDSLIKAEIKAADSLIKAEIKQHIRNAVHQRANRQLYDEDNLLEIPRRLEVLGKICIILIFGFPLFLVGIILYFRYKNKKARYEIMKQAIQHGQSLPAEFADECAAVPTMPVRNDLLWQKGVKMFFLGLGLALFLGILTDEAELSSIGILIMCIGGGKIVIGCFPSASALKQRFGKANAAPAVRTENAPQPKEEEASPEAPCAAEAETKTPAVPEAEQATQEETPTENTQGTTEA